MAFEDKGAWKVENQRDKRNIFKNVAMAQKERLESANDGGKRGSKRHSGQPTWENTQNLKKVIHARMFGWFL